MSLIICDRSNINYAFVSSTFLQLAQRKITAEITQHRCDKPIFKWTRLDSKFSRARAIELRSWQMKFKHARILCITQRIRRIRNPLKPVLNDQLVRRAEMNSESHKRDIY